MGELLGGRVHAAARSSWSGCRIWTSSSTARERLCRFITSIWLNSAHQVTAAALRCAMEDKFPGSVAEKCRTALSQKAA